MKIQKLKQNLCKEVVWVMKDDSFVNFIYFLSVENYFNNNFILNKNNNLNNSRFIKKINKNLIINTCLKGNNNNNNITN